MQPHSIHDLDGNRIAEYDYDDVAGTSTLIREYIWMNGQVVAVIEGGAVYYARTDHIGRPVFATNGSGIKVWEASYLPFGGVHASTGSSMGLRFPGQWFQSEAGLHQNWMRDYDPTLGRYIQADPLGLVDGASVYGYALQNPGRYIDPRGEAVDPKSKMGIPERISQESHDCFINEEFEVAGLGNWCKKAISKVVGLYKAIPIVCAIVMGADDNPKTNYPRRGGREQHEPKPGGNPPREDDYTHQPIDPPIKK